MGYPHSACKFYSSAQGKSVITVIKYANKQTVATHPNLDPADI